MQFAPNDKAIFRYIGPATGAVAGIAAANGARPVTIVIATRDAAGEPLYWCSTTPAPGIPSRRFCAGETELQPVW